MSKSHPDDDRPATGFAALSSQVSKVDDAIAQAAKSQSEDTSGPDPQSQSAEPTSSFDSSAYDRPVQTDNGSGGGWWVGGLVVAGIIWAANQPSENNTASPPPAPIAETMPSVGTVYQPSENYAAPPVPEPVPEPAPEPITESMPSVGTGQTLTTSELRYCLAEQVRMDAAETVVDSYNWRQVDQYNAMVTDYNLRCGEFRYQPSSMSVAQDYVNANRFELEQEGQSRIANVSE